MHNLKTKQRIHPTQRHTYGLQPPARPTQTQHQQKKKTTAAYQEGTKQNPFTDKQEYKTTYTGTN